MIRKKRCTFMIEPEVLDRLHSITVRTGLSTSEQIRQGIRWWLESREWPARSQPPDVSASEAQPVRPRLARGPRRRSGRRP